MTTTQMGSEQSQQFPKKQQGLSTKVRIEPSALTPSIATKQAAMEDSRWFWIGTLPECPDWAPVFDGMDFPKFSEVVSKRDGKTLRVPVVGHCVKLTHERVKRIAALIGRTVIRFHGGSGKSHGADAGVGSTAMELKTPKRKGTIIKIATPAEIDEKRKAALPAPIYEPTTADEPIAHYVFMIPCTDQKNGGRMGDAYPDPVAVTGIEWPEK